MGNSISNYRGPCITLGFLFQVTLLFSYFEPQGFRSFTTYGFGFRVSRVGFRLRDISRFWRLVLRIRVRTEDLEFNLAMQALGYGLCRRTVPKT